MFLLAAMAFLLTACYPDGPDAVTNYYVVATQNDPSFNFSKVKTYVLVDSVVQLGDRPDKHSMVLTPKRNAFILQQVAGQLNALGYTPVTSPADGQQPDVMVQVSAVVTENTAAYYNDSWWDSWDWYPGWAYYYPYVGGGWYPYGAIGSYRYRTGTLQHRDVQPGRRGCFRQTNSPRVDRRPGKHPHQQHPQPGRPPRQRHREGLPAVALPQTRKSVTPCIEWLYGWMAIWLNGFAYARTTSRQSTIQPSSHPAIQPYSLQLTHYP